MAVGIWSELLFKLDYRIPVYIRDKIMMKLPLSNACSGTSNNNSGVHLFKDGGSGVHLFRNGEGFEDGDAFR